MRDPTQEHGPPIAHRRIPRLMLAAMGLSLAWFVPVGWLAYWGHVDTVLIMLFVTAFAVVALGLPWLLARASRGRIETVSAYNLRRWLGGKFETYTGRVSGRDAIVQILLPLAAAAVAFTGIGIVLAVVSGGSSWL